MMYPVYMDSYPQAFTRHRDQTQYAHQYHPNSEGVPPQMTTNTVKPPSCYGPRPYNSNFSYSGPTDCNGCWGHGYPPGYYSFRPLHPTTQSPQLYFHGPYPPHPDSYPAYFVPPLYFPADQGQSHFCGCLNPSCHPKDDNSLKIEEQKPEVESKDNGSSTMIQWPNYPHPVFWVPPSFTKATDASKAPESPQPAVWDRWIPLDMNSLKASRQGGDMKSETRQKGGKKTQSPPPMIWMPSDDQPQDKEKNLKEVSVSPKVEEELPSKFKIIPIKLLENQDSGDKPGVAEEYSDHQVHSTPAAKESRSKSIPVKQIEESTQEKAIVPEKEWICGGEKQLGIPEKHKEVAAEKKTMENGSRKQASPGKSSELPPVCLRVDPLPRRKMGNASCRSPSPPSIKEKEKVQHENKEGGSSKPEETRKENPKIKDAKVVQIENRTSKTKKEAGENNGMPADCTKNISGKESAGVTVTGKSEDMAKESEGVFHVLEGEKQGELDIVGGGKSGRCEEKIEDDNKAMEGISGKFEVKAGDGKVAMGTSDNKKMAEMEERREKMSESDAALLIQSAYRGFEMRRWEPLKKLRQIARVRAQVSGIRQEIHKFEASSEKWRVVIGETVMNLLLQLDTIQGLHPSVTEIRKAVARELVALQERLDALACKTAEGHTPIEDRDSLTDTTSWGHHQAVCDDREALTDTTSDGLRRQRFKLTESTSDTKEFVQPSVEKDVLEYLAIDKQEEAVSDQITSAETVQGEGQLPHSRPEDLKVHPLLPERTLLKKGLDSEVGIIEKSQLVSEKTHHKSEESAKPATAEDNEAYLIVTRAFELPAKDEATHLEGKEHREPQLEVKDEILEHPSDKEESSQAGFLLPLEERPDPEAVEDSSEGGLFIPEEEKTDPSVGGLHAAPAMKEDVLVNMQETGPISNLGGLELISANSKEPDAVGKTSLVKNEELDSREEKLPVPQAVKEDDCLVEELAGISEVESSIPPEISCFDSAIPEAGVQEDDAKIIGENNDVPASEALGLMEATIPSKDENHHHSLSSLEQPNEEIELNSRSETVAEASSLPAESGNEAQTSPEVPATDQILETVLDLSTEVRRMEEENKKLRERLDKLLEAGKEQMVVISDLNEKVKEVKKRVARKKRLRMRQHKASRT